MSKPKAAVIGCTGMLGAITLDYLVGTGDFELFATHRNVGGDATLKQQYPNVTFRTLDAEKLDGDEIAAAIAGTEWVVNAIGIIKPYIHDDNPEEVERAIRVNALFPHLLAKAAQKNGSKVIQIATDCVYSGEKGKYVESDLHDALDVYGKSKSLGEAYLDSSYHLRGSIIGPETKAHLSLLDWFLGQPENASLNGFTNHQWNGVTTLHFAKLCHGIITNGIALPHLQHVVPGNLITKANLLRSFAKEFGREDIVINDTEAPKVIDRTLSTDNGELNAQLWKAAGYSQPPTIEQMVAELAAYGFGAKQGSKS